MTAQRSEEAPATLESEPSAAAGEKFQLLLLAPTGRDAALTSQILQDAQIATSPCPTLSILCDRLDETTLALLLTTEGLDVNGMQRLTGLLGQQPAWSDLPVILLATATQANAVGPITDALGNVTVLERPLSRSSLLSTVWAAIRARHRQFQVRDLLRETEQARQSAEEQNRHIASLNERLQRSMMETHHRVKNNLQIITAMIDMQVMEDGATVPIAEMKRLSTHVRVLAAVHDMLTQQARTDADNATLSAKAILEKLLAMMQATAGNHSITYKTEDAILTVRQATSLALVVNELVNNALKHGKSAVEITMARDDHYLELQVCDDGAGFPPNFDPIKAAHTGLELVENLTRWDLEGTSRYENRQPVGAKVSIRLPVAA